MMRSPYVMRSSGLLTRRTAMKLSLGAAASALAAPALSQSTPDKILIGLPLSLSTPYGVADDTDLLISTES